MRWGEAYRLTKILAADPTSQVAGAVHDWDRPWSLEWAATADLIDAFSAANFKNPKPYKRPWRDPNARRHGRTNKSRAEVISILRAHGHEIEG